MPTNSEVRSWRDSWPPTQVRLAPLTRNKDDPRPLLEDIDEDPLTYFLTPAPDADDDDVEDDIMDFDAGIESPGSFRGIVRSVSPSSLDGLSKPKRRPSSPECDSGCTTSDDDDDEDYIRFTPRRPGMLSLRDFTMDSLRYNSRSPVFGRSANGLLSPASYPGSPPLRGRSQARRTQGRTRSLSASARARPGHLWREPSPDVWSIEEETEDELVSALKGSSSEGQDYFGDVNKKSTTTLVDGSTAKPVKKVRFLLPDEE